MATKPGQDLKCFKLFFSRQRLLGTARWQRTKRIPTAHSSSAYLKATKMALHDAKAQWFFPWKLYESHGFVLKASIAGLSQAIRLLKPVGPRHALHSHLVEPNSLGAQEAGALVAQGARHLAHSFRCLASREIYIVKHPSNSFYNYLSLFSF